MATVDLGKVAFVWKGTYASGTTYESKDVVQYTDSGETSSYIYVNASSASGQTPSTSGTVNTTYWAKMAGGTSLAVGNNKIVTTDASGNVSSVALGTAGQALKVNSSANGLEFGGAGQNIVAKTDSTRRATTSSVDIINVNIVATKTNPTIHVVSSVGINASDDSNLDNENFKFDIRYSIDGGSNYTTGVNDAYSTDVFAPGGGGRSHTHTYDVMTRLANGSFTATGASAGTTINVVVRYDHSNVQNSETAYINRSVNGGGYMNTSLIVYEE